MARSIEGLCSVSGCVRTKYGREYCRSHYLRYLRYGDPTAGRRHRQRAERYCTASGCGRLHYARGYCWRHWDRLRRTGSALPPSERAKFYSKARVAPSDSCWEWLGSTVGAGYGCYLDGNAHRAAWELDHGPIPPGHEIHHTCKNRRCVNPSHLACMTRAEHMAAHAAANKERVHV